MDTLATGHLPRAQQSTVSAGPRVYANGFILISFKLEGKKIMLNDNIVISLTMNNNGHNNDCIIMSPA